MILESLHMILQICIIFQKNLKMDGPFHIPKIRIITNTSWNFTRKTQYYGKAQIAIHSSALN